MMKSIKKIKITSDMKIKNIDFTGMSFPSRLSLWSGILIIIYSYLSQSLGIFLIGSLLVIAGVIFWYMYGPESLLLKKVKLKLLKIKSRNPNNQNIYEYKKKSLKDGLKELEDMKTKKEQHKVDNESDGDKIVQRAQETLNTLREDAKYLDEIKKA